MSRGRTSWWGKDGRWWGRERHVVLGQEFGTEGPGILDWLTCEAQLQREGGRVKAGYAAIAHGCFAADIDRVRAIVRRAAEIGALDDFVERGMTFTARISGWAADQAAIHAAERQAAKRARDNEAEDNGASHPVTDSNDESRITRPDQDQTSKEDSLRSSSPREREIDEQVAELFAYWQEKCGHPQAELTPKRRRKIRDRLREKRFTAQHVREGIDGAAVGAVEKGGKRFDDIELICRDPEKLESFIGREGPPVDDTVRQLPVRPESPSDLLRALDGAA